MGELESFLAKHIETLKENQTISIALTRGFYQITVEEQQYSSLVITTVYPKSKASKKDLGKQIARHLRMISEEPDLLKPTFGSRIIM